MATLMDATQRILDSASPAEELRLADGYMRLWLANPNAFVLPKDHAHLAPIIEAYAENFTKFHRYIKAIRDEVFHAHGPRSEQYVGMQELFRVAEVRLVQANRRERLRQCVEWFAKKYPQVTAVHRRAWARKLEQKWAKGRTAAMSAARRAAGGRLSEDARREVLDAFWASVDESIANGDLPGYE